MSRENCDKCHAENVTKSVTMSRKMCDKTPDPSREMSRFTRDTAPSPSSPSPAPFLPPSPPTPPVTPYNPPNPNPVILSPFKKNAEYSATDAVGICAQLGINSAWKSSERARPAVAQRLVDWICDRNLPAAKYRNLHDLICESLEKGVSPEEIIAIAARDSGSCFSGDIANAQRNALRKRGLL